MNAKIHNYSISALLSSFTITMAAVLTGGCASNSEIVLSKLDPRTSVTITYNESPLVFFRTHSASAARTNEHVYIGPVEVNRSGDYRYYLWLAAWGPMDVMQHDRRHDRFESIDVIADGRPVTLKLSGNSSRAIGASEPVYRKPVAWATEAYYDVTLDQIRLIAEATDLQVQYSSTLETFEPWDDQTSAKAGLVEFLDASVYFAD